MFLVGPPPAFGHLREAYPQGAPKYDNKNLSADSKSAWLDLGEEWEGVQVSKSSVVSKLLN